MPFLKDKHAVVTGAGTGIWAAIADAMAGEGACVTILGRRHEVLERVSARRRGILHPVQADVTDEDSIRTALQFMTTGRHSVSARIDGARTRNSVRAAFSLDLPRRTRRNRAGSSNRPTSIQIPHGESCGRDADRYRGRTLMAAAPVDLGSPDRVEGRT